MPDIKFLILVAAVIVNILLTLIVLLRDPRSVTNRCFSFFGSVATVWLASSYLSTTPQTNLYWARFTIFFATLMIMSLFLFAYTLPHKNSQLGKWKTVFLVLATVLVMLITISPYAFVGISTDGGASRLIVGPGMGAFGVLVTFLSFATVRILWKKMRESSGIDRQQVRFVFLGIIIMLSLLIMTVLIPTALFQKDTFVPYMPLYTLIFLSMSAYAIIRYRFLDIKAFIVRAVSFLVLVFIGALVYALVIFIGIRSIFSVEINTSFFISAYAITVIAMVTFEPVEAKIRKLTGQLFYKDAYDSDELLAKLTKIMVETIDFNDMTGKILTVLKSGIKIEKVALAITIDHKIEEIIGIGYSNLRGDSELEDLFHKYFFKKSYIGFDELDQGSLKELLRSRDILFAIPLRVQADEVAILILGSKLSGEPYSQKDINLLNVFGAEAGIAIQNAKAYKRIKEFSKELEKKVDERTVELKITQDRELEKARQVAKLKDEFVFIAAHELRTPVTAIRGFLELVSEAMGDFPKDVKNHLTSISEASEHLNQLINDLLQISRTDSGTMTVTTMAVEVEPIVKMILKELLPIADKRNISVNYRTEISRVKALADAKKLSEVVMNILSNAIKYNKDGGSVDISIYGFEDKVMIEVNDTGYGIPKDEQGRVFQKFFRAGSKGTEDVLGTGLGLFISKILVEKMGGELRFSSIEGEGSTFGIMLPMAERPGI